jgi:hypothetical protein
VISCYRQERLPVNIGPEIAGPVSTTESGGKNEHEKKEEEEDTRDKMWDAENEMRRLVTHAELSRTACRPVHGPCPRNGIRPGVCAGLSKVRARGLTPRSEAVL